MSGRQKLLVAALVLLVAIFAWKRLAPALAPDDGLGGGPAGVSRDAGAVRVVELETGRLDHQRATYAPGRDPFRYYQPPPPQPAGPTPEELAAMEEAWRRAEAARAAAAAAAAEAARNAPPQPPEFAMAFLGSFGPKDKKIAVFADGEDIYNALVGDVIQNRFVVVRIGYESVDIGYVDFPDLPATRLPVGG
jgi:hypothetical protein